MEAHRLAGNRAAAGDDVEDPFGKPGLGAEFGKAQQRERGHLRRFQHDGIAGGKRRGDLPRADHQREVPRHDGADDADRLTVDEGEDVARGRRDLAIDLVDRLGIIAEAAGGAAGLGLQRHGDFRAVVAHAEHGKLQRVFLDQLGDPQQHLLALGGRGLRPAALLEGGAGGLHRPLDIRRAGIGDRRQAPPVDGRDDVERCPALRLAEGAVDEQRLRGDDAVAERFDLFLHGLSSVTGGAGAPPHCLRLRGRRRAGRRRRHRRP